MEGEDIAGEIYSYAQQCIEKAHNHEFQEFPEWHMCY